MRERRALPAGDPRRPMLALVAVLEAEIAAGKVGPMTAWNIKRFRSFATVDFHAGDGLDVIRGQLAQRMLEEHPVTEKKDPPRPPGRGMTEITRRRTS